MSAERDPGLEAYKSYTLEELEYYLSVRSKEDKSGKFGRHVRQRLGFIKKLPQGASFSFDADRFEILISEKEEIETY